MAPPELDALLAVDAGSIRAFERHEFDRCSQGRPLVLMGAGGLGRMALAGLRRHGVEPLAFADNAASNQRNDIEGIPVLSPEAAAREFRRRAAFVVTIWGANRPHRFAHSRMQLQQLGCDVVCPFPPLFWKYAETFLPYYLQDLPSKLVEARTDISHAFDLWEDDASRSEYLAQLRLRLSADFDGLSHPVAHPQYFPDDLYDWRDDEWIVDGGAYDGDTIRAVSRLYGGRFAHLLAIEPDPGNFARLEATIADLPPEARLKVDSRHLALASDHTTLYLDPTGTASSTTTTTASEDSATVSAVPLDALLGANRPSVIKLDIEGFEPDALQGARRTIEQHAPILAICVYHRQDHLWSIPLMLREWRDDYAFFLRPHNEEGWDLVCYAVPRQRLTWTRA